MDSDFGKNEVKKGTDENGGRNSKPGRVNGKNSKHISGGVRIFKKLHNQIVEVLQLNRDKGAAKDKKVGYETQEKRTTVVHGFFSDLFKLGFKIESVHSLKEKHLVAVFNYLEEMGQSPSTIQNKISIMRLFCDWIGKNGMVRDSSRYVKNRASVKRSTVVREDKSWVGNGVSVMDKIAEVSTEDMKIALRLELCLAFGLRVKEAMSLRPALATEGNFKGAGVHVRDGTKGGRSRVVPIENEVQLDVLARAMAMSDKTSGFLPSAGKNDKARLRHFYHVMEKCGLTLAEEGVTAHGLRHQYLHESFKTLLDIEPPVRGGDLSQIDKEDFHLATQKLMERAGHSRVSIGSAYFGSQKVFPS